MRLDGSTFLCIRKGHRVKYETVCVLPGGIILRALEVAVDTDGLVWYEMIYEIRSVYLEPAPDDRRDGRCSDRVSGEPLGQHSREYDPPWQGPGNG